MLLQVAFFLKNKKIKRKSPNLTVIFHFQVPLIDQLELRMHATLKQRSEQLIERRRQDIKDQSEELSPVSSQYVIFTSGDIFLGLDSF